MTKQEIGNVTLLNGDCLDLLNEVPDNSIDMVCCDLPYGTTQCKWDSPIDLPSLWKQYTRVTRKGAAIVLFAQTPFDKVLGCSNLPWLRYEFVWEKGNATGHLNAKKMPLKAHENILVFYDSLPTYNPQKTQGHARKTATKRKDITSVYGRQEFDEVKYDSTERFPRSVLRVPSDKQKLNLHPAQKPEALVEWLVRTYTYEGDTVLDNCMGSGTTGVVCAYAKRKFIGMEKDTNHFSNALDRIRRTA